MGTELDRLLERPPGRDPDARRMYKPLLMQRDRLFTFLLEPGLEATNNLAERMLRPGVITWKTGGCNRTAEGAEAHAGLVSLLATLKQQRRHVLRSLDAVLTVPGPSPPLFAAPPP